MIILYKIAVIYFLITCYADASCPSSCNQKGTCDKYSRCICQDGYTGGDCSLRTCPYGNAWADQATAINVAHASAECSNRGSCDRDTGLCACMEGFDGKACQYLGCNNKCTEAGKCYSMETKAVRTRDSNSIGYKYNGVWDSEKIYGCVCDNSRQYYDCSGFVCPTGDDPLTTGQVNEQQMFKCRAISGSFTIYYKGESSPYIAYNANQAAVQAALLLIPNLFGIKVTFTSGALTPVCAAIPQVVLVEFTYQFGPQPPLLPFLDSTMTNAGGSIIVSGDGRSILQNSGSNTKYISVKGTKESDPCANRGELELGLGLGPI
jgi:hypothetical protein